jgi:hypothetical protein
LYLYFWIKHNIVFLILTILYQPHYQGVTSMNLELIGQLVSVALIVGAGPIIVAAVYARGGNL